MAVSAMSYAVLIGEASVSGYATNSYGRRAVNVNIFMAIAHWPKPYTPAPEVARRHGFGFLTYGCVLRGVAVASRHKRGLILRVLCRGGIVPSKDFIICVKRYVIAGNVRLIGNMAAKRRRCEAI